MFQCHVLKEIKEKKFFVINLLEQDKTCLRFNSRALGTLVFMIWTKNMLFSFKNVCSFENNPSGIPYVGERVVYQ